MQTTIRWIFRSLAILAAILASIQPVLGSFAFFRRSDSIGYETIHITAGSGIYYLSVLLGLLSLFTGFRRRWSLLSICIVLFVISQVQLLLGIESDTDATLLAYYIPLGVLILLLTYVIAGLSFGATLDTDLA